MWQSRVQKCVHSLKGLIDEAYKAFNSTAKRRWMPDATPYNVIIHGHCRAGNFVCIDEWFSGNSPCNAKKDHLYRQRLMTMLFIWHKKIISVELDYSTAMFDICCMVHFVASSYSTKSRSISIWYG
ncbi:hypothetical protein B296_00037747 [Ensete ventricosum]|uniref:Uncharacterized protein n=1 Tax=Ensete ventricosum TaxID=4639 RepID=A0A426ZYN3_ENSVE|nr:hypothetical protein B296_00037747 [Ensete ventricosum]